MAAFDLEEQEQIDELKTWWKQYGNLVTGLLIAVLLGMSSWQGWNWWQRDQAVQSSALYAAVDRASNAHDARKSRELAGEIIDRFPRSVYAGMAALQSARAQMEANDPKSAKAQLGWASEHASDAGIRDLARLRLVSLLLEEKNYDEAVRLLSVTPDASFAPRFAEMKGDTLALQGKPDEARLAYQDALNRLDEARKKSASELPQAAYREMVLTKLESLGASPKSTGGQKP